MTIARFLDRLRSRGGAIAYDLLVIPAAWLGAYWLRFNLDTIPAAFLAQAVAVLPVIIAIQGSILLYFDMHRGVWRFTSLPDLKRIFQAVGSGVPLCVLAVFLLTRMDYVPRSALLMFAVLLVVFLSGPRIACRWFRDPAHGEAHSQGVLVVGAGRAGDTLVRAMLNGSLRGYRPVGFVDDDSRKQHRDVQGVRVLGACRQIPAVAARTGADVIAIATPSASTIQMRKIIECAAGARLPIRTVSRSPDTAAGDLREVEIEDLLGRPPAVLDWSRTRSELTGCTVLVTGGAGSIGSELCRHVARLDPERLVVVDVTEFNLYRIERDLRAAYPSLALSIVLADVSDEAAMNRVFERHAPGVVFHAAAYKHVPMLEPQAREAVRVNVLGTHVVAGAALRHGADRFVLISTDKAVQPVSVMGASKQLAEQVCRAADDVSSTRCVAVRFGNVVDSTGNVVSLFREQIARGGPVTVTDLDMKRYLMTASEACRLVMAAAVLGTGGEVFVLDMGEPMRIMELAEQMVRLAGRTPGKDIAIQIVGARPGDKTCERLSHPDEPLTSTSQEHVFRLRPPPGDARFPARLAALREACEAFDEPAVERLLAELVPDYRPRRAPARIVRDQSGRSPANVPRQ